jgi:UDP:flavonoid glycosyltransferase YjiC (YdhE family)
MARARAVGVEDACATWRPDVLVFDETDFGGMITAERLDLPYAVVLVTAAGSFVRAELLAGTLDVLRAEYDLPPDPALDMLGRYLVLSPVPAGFRDPTRPLPATAHPVNAGVPGDGDPAPPWLDDLDDAPIVYFTLGTVFNMESGDLFTRVLTGLRELPVNLVVTVGEHIDPAEFGPQPPNVRVERYLPQAAVLARCRAVVSHGGSGSVLGALAYGRPMVLIPMGADQPLNAARCADLGVARVLDAVAATPAQIRTATWTVLTEPAYRHAARRLRDEYARLPGPAHAVGLLERLAADRRPVPSGG